MANKPIDIQINASVSGESDVEDLTRGLNTLGEQQGLIDTFEKVKSETTATGERLEALQAEVRQAALALKEKQAAAEAAAAAERASTAELAQAKAAHNDLRTAVQGATQELQMLKAAAKEGGDETGELAMQINLAERDLVDLKAQAQAAGEGVAELAAANRDNVAESKAANKELGAAQNAFDGVRQSAANTKKEYNDQQQALQGARDALGEAGISSTNLAQAQADLNRNTEAAKAAVEQQAQELRTARQSSQELADAHKLLGTTSQAEMQRMADEAQQAYDLIESSGTASVQALQKAWQVATQAAIDANAGVATEAQKAAAAQQGLAIEVDKSGRAVVKSLNDIKNESSGVDKAFSTLSKTMLGLFGAAQIKNAIDMSDRFGQMAERVRMATESTAEFDVVQASLLDTANRTFRPLAEQQELYIRTSQSLKDLGYNTQQVLDITSSYSFLLTTNAASADKAKSANDAYAKSLQRGALDGDSWNAMLTATPTLVQAISDATGLSTKEVRDLGSTGKLSLRDLNQGLALSVDLNREVAEGMKTTRADAMVSLSNAWGELLRQMNESTGVTEKMVSLTGLLTDNLETVVALSTAAGAVMVSVWGVKALASLTAYIASLRTASAATQALTLETLKATGAAATLQKAGAVAAAAWVGWEIGSYLRNEFEIVEKAGIALAAGLTKTAAVAKGAIELVKATFSDTSYAEVMAQTRAELEEIDRVYGEMFANVGKVDEAVKTSTTSLKAQGEQARTTAESLALLVTDLGPSFEALGLDAARALNVISKEGAAAIRGVEDIASSLEKAGVTSQEAGNAIESALVAALGKVKSNAEIDALQKQLTTLTQSGQLSAEAADRLTTAIQEQRAAILRASPAYQARIAESQRLAEAAGLEAQAINNTRRVQQELLAAGIDLLRHKAEEARQRGLNVTAAELERQAALAELEVKRLGIQMAQTEAELKQKLSKLKQQALQLERDQLLVDLQRTAAAEEKNFAAIAEINLQIQKNALQQEALEAEQALFDAELLRYEQQSGFIDVAERNIASQNRLRDALNQTGDAGRRAGRQVSDGMKEVESASTNALGAIEEAGKKVQATWLSAEAASSKYAKEAAAHAYSVTQSIGQMLGEGVTGWSRYREAVGGHLAALERNADAYIASMSRLDSLNAALDRSTSKWASATRDLQDQLLELNGTEQEILNNRRARQREEAELEKAKLDIELQRAMLRKDDDEAQRIREEMKAIDAYTKQLEANYKAQDAKAAADKRAADQKTRDEAKAAQQDSAASGSSNTNNNSTPNQSIGTTSTRVIDLRLNGQRQGSVTTDAAGEAVLSGFMDQLERDARLTGA